MARPKLQTWYAKVSETMVREGKTFRMAVNVHEIDLHDDEFQRIERSQEFQATLWAERMRYYNEIASSPGRTKTAIAGIVTISIQKLFDAGEYEKVVEACLKLAKIEGWMGAENTVNIFENVSAKDYEAARKELLALLGNPSEADSG